jgi:hypothetical protein
MRIVERRCDAAHEIQGFLEWNLAVAQEAVAE